VKTNIGKYFIIIVVFRRGNKKELKYVDETQKSLVNKVPNYKGYENVKDRNPTDKAIRKYLSLKVDENINLFSTVTQKLLQHQILSTWKYSDEIKQKLEQLAKTLNAKDTDIYRHSTFFDTPKVEEWIDIPVLYILESEMIIICDSLRRSLTNLLDQLLGDNLSDVESKIKSVRADVSELHTMVLDRAELLASFEIVGF
jgi:hypothetical protein